MVIISMVRDGVYEVKEGKDATLVGEIIQDVDGFYVFYPFTKGVDAWSERLLSAIAEKITHLNQEIQTGVLDRLYKNGL